MDNPIFPYGPSPGRLDNLVKMLVMSTEPKVTLDFLEELGVPKTQVSISLSGLKQLGFVTSEGKITELCRRFADPSSRPGACEEIIRTVYHPLLMIAEANPSTADKMCHDYLKRLGRGDSARHKILKLFWYFWSESGRGFSEPTICLEKESNLSDSANPNNTHKDLVGTTSTEPLDHEALHLAESLLQFCKSREQRLAEKKAQLTALEKECSELEAELQHVRELLHQHLTRYPAVAALLESSPWLTMIKE